MIFLVAADSILRQISSLTVGTMLALACKTIWALMSSDPICQVANALVTRSRTAGLAHDRENVALSVGTVVYVTMFVALALAPLSLERRSIAHSLGLWLGHRRNGPTPLDRACQKRRWGARSSGEATPRYRTGALDRHPTA
jgi:hypothetical protein